MESFQELGLPAFLGQSLKQMNFVKPTPVQAQAIPAALQGKDVIASAQTGTGKTAAFGIPLLAFLAEHTDQTALILTPTRELAVQVLDVLRKLSGMNSPWGSVLLIGGANMGAQLSALSRKPRLFIGTPGRVIDHLNRGSLHLAHSGFLVLDEADRMLDMGFAPQLEEIRKRLPAKRQTLLFSATIPPNIQAMASRYMKDPVRITVGDVSQPVLKIAQMVIYTSETKKAEELIGELNERQGSVLLFCRTQNRVDRLMERLKEQGFKATRIHGGRSQSQRRQAIDHFREGHYRVLVATDIAARGLDIHHIAHVINYDLPRNPEDYIHRVGRTARMGAEGSSLCLLTPEDRNLWERILKLMGLPKESIQVKKSRFGDFTPKVSTAPHGSHRSGAGRSEGHPQRHDRSNDRHRDRQGFRPNRPFDKTQGRPGSRHEGAAHRDRHPGGHSRGSERPFRSRHSGGEDAQGNKFIFHGPDDGFDSQRSLTTHRQPSQNDRGEWKPKPEGFIKRFTNQFTHKNRNSDSSRPFSNDGNSRSRPENRPSRDGRLKSFGDRGGNSSRPFSREGHSGNRPFGDRRPHSPSRESRGTDRFRGDSQPRGNFKKREFRSENP